ncbi:MAG: hypothetical protein KDM91_06250 [Verrucomicrobiae bacterium]|nr:hypothetical protein [Verrucomicrobiae bacterium]MCP5540829.1 hypothetical protein [Akkermansiaceae bacterium]
MKAGSHRRSRGEAVSNLLAYLAVSGVFASLIYPGVARFIDAASESKLAADAHILNRAVSVYVQNGGEIPEGLSMGEALERIQSPPWGQPIRLTYHSLPDTDLAGKDGATAILSPVMQTQREAEKGKIRILWNEAVRGFEITEIGKPGAKAFELVPRRLEPVEPAKPAVLEVTETSDTDTLFAPYRH